MQVQQDRIHNKPYNQRLNISHTRILLFGAAKTDTVKVGAPKLTPEQEACLNKPIGLPHWICLDPFYPARGPSPLHGSGPKANSIPSWTLRDVLGLLIELGADKKLIDVTYLNYQLNPIPRVILENKGLRRKLRDFQSNWPGFDLHPPKNIGLEYPPETAEIEERAEYGLNALIQADLLNYAFFPQESKIYVRLSDHAADLKKAGKLLLPSPKLERLNALHQEYRIALQKAVLSQEITLADQNGTYEQIFGHLIGTHFNKKDRMSEESFNTMLAMQDEETRQFYRTLMGDLQALKLITMSYKKPAFEDYSPEFSERKPEIDYYTLTPDARLLFPKPKSRWKFWN